MRVRIEVPLKDYIVANKDSIWEYKAAATYDYAKQLAPVSVLVIPLRLYPTKANPKQFASSYTFNNPVP